MFFSLKILDDKEFKKLSSKAQAELVLNQKLGQTIREKYLELMSVKGWNKAEFKALAKDLLTQQSQSPVTVVKEVPAQSKPQSKSKWSRTLIGLLALLAVDNIAFHKLPLIKQWFASTDLMTEPPKKSELQMTDLKDIEKLLASKKISEKELMELLQSPSVSKEAKLKIIKSLKQNYLRTLETVLIPEIHKGKTSLSSAVYQLTQKATQIDAQDQINEAIEINDQSMSLSNDYFKKRAQDVKELVEDAKKKRNKKRGKKQKVNAVPPTTPSKFSIKERDRNDKSDISSQRGGN